MNNVIFSKGGSYCGKEAVNNSVKLTALKGKYGFNFYTV